MDKDKIWALGMTLSGTYVPGLEEVYMPQACVRVKKYKPVKLELEEEI